MRQTNLATKLSKGMMAYTGIARIIITNRKLVPQRG